MKFKSDIEVQAGLKDSSGAAGTSGQVLSSNGTTVSWINSDIGVASDVQNQVKAGVAINKGQAVYVTSADGTNIIVGLASNATEATSSKTLGLLNATVAINGFADVIQIGKLAGLDTSTAVVGDPVWLGSNGNLIYGLANKPYAPAHLVFIGIVTRVNANNGEIFVTVQNGFELKEIHDVDIITNVPINGDVLGYDGTLWVNKTIAEWLGYTPADQAITISTTAPLSGGGNLSANRTLSIAQANATTNGYLSSADWTNFNNKQTALNGTGFVKASGTTISYDNSTYVPTSRTITINGVTQDLSANQTWTVSGGIDGSGTANYVSKFIDADTIGNSLIYDNGSSVGIGINVPTARLDIRSPATSASTSSPTLRAFGYSTNSYFEINNNGNNSANIKLTRSDSATVFSVDGHSGLSYFLGNVLIGTTTDAGYKLDVNGSMRGTRLNLGQLGLAIDVWNFYSQTVSGAMGILGHNLRASSTVNNQVDVVNGSWYSSMIKQYYNEGITFHTSDTSYAAGAVYPIAATERMRITSGGNVGIGTTSPDAIFTVNKTNTNYTDASAGHILLDNSSAAGQSSIYYKINGTIRAKLRADVEGSMNFIANGGNHEFWTGGDAGVGSIKMRITSGGNVLIGTTTDAGYKLEVIGSTRITGGAEMFYLRNSTTNAMQGRIGVRDDGAMQIYSYQSSVGYKPILLGVDGTFTGGGNVGIGTLNPYSKLTVEEGITYGAYGPNKSTISAVNTTTDGKAGFIDVVGYSGNSVSPYRCGGISGGKSTTVGDGNYGGYLSLWTTSGGGNGEANSASYERMRISSSGVASIYNLAGTGTRFVTADASGNLSTTTDGAVTSYNSTLTLNTSWQNTGIDSSVITTSGVYLVTCLANDYAVGGAQYSCTYVGTMYFYASGTNGVNANEIALHHSGHADNGRYIYLRTLGSLGADSKLYLQIKGNGTNTGNSTYVFTFKKLL